MAAKIVKKESDGTTTVSSGASCVSYRQFRAEVIGQCREDWARRWGADPDVSAFSLLRRQVRAFRHQLSSTAVAWIESGRYPRQYLHRALRLHAGFSPTLSRRERWLSKWMWLVPSTHTMMRLAVPWLRMARTFEGRSLIFHERLPPGRKKNSVHYTRALDFGLMRWGRFASEENMIKFSMIHFDWIRAAVHLGLNDTQLMLKWIPPHPHGKSARLMWLLVREGAITSLAERAWVDQWHRSDYSAGIQELDEQRIADVIRILRLFHVERERIVEALCTLPHHYLNPESLKQTLDLLCARGISQLGLLLQGLGICLSTVPAARWIDLLDRLNVRDSAELIQFRPLLVSKNPISLELGHALVQHGASATDLARCQNLLLKAGAAQNGHPTVAALSTLTSPPHSFNFTQIGDAIVYLTEPDGLRPYLEVLKEYGFASADAVLRFQPFYAKLRPRQLARLLALTRSLHKASPIDEFEWVRAASNARHIDAFEYLASALNVRTVRQLLRFDKLGFLGVPLLRHLVEVHGLRTRKLLTDWFYNRAYGIKSVRWSGTSLDSINCILFDDAFKRQAFNYWESNLQCVFESVHQQVRNQLGSVPINGSEDERRDYWAAEEIATKAARAALLPTMSQILEGTSGILLPSVVACAWSTPDALTRQLALLAPILDDLLEGRGPLTPTLTQLEVEAIALIYRTGPATVRQRWNHVIDHETDIADWGAASCYRMIWHRTDSTLHEPLDREGLESLVRAAQMATVFRETYTTDMARACDAIGLTENRAATGWAEPGDALDLPALFPQLSLLLAVAVSDPAAGRWLLAMAESAGELDAGTYMRILNLQTFFGVGLADVLHACGQEFCQTLPTPSSVLLTHRLNPKAEPAREPYSALYDLLLQAHAKVGPAMHMWATKELAKFDMNQTGGGRVEKNAVLTKTPAAFFAKEAAKLCTADNVLMWEEKRQAHLVVYDQVRRNFQGMALIYREVLPRIHFTKPVLVIRAINPTAEVLATYHISEVVDAFMETAVCIARDSGCVAVAFPPNTTQHLLSNLDPVHKDIEQRYLVHRKTHTGRLPQDQEDRWLRPAEEIKVPFDAYECGAHRIDTLYLVWKRGA